MTAVTVCDLKGEDNPRQPFTKAMHICVDVDVPAEADTHLPPAPLLSCRASFFRLLELTGAKEPAALEKLVKAVGVAPASVNKDLLMYKGVLSKLSAAKVRQEQGSWGLYRRTWDG